MSSDSHQLIFSNAIQSQGVLQDPGLADLLINEKLPRPAVSPVPVASEKVRLLPGLFKERRELTKAYLNRLSTRNLLQNHMLEAGIRFDDPCEDLHQGWEAPHCQLRGHFAGHWLSAAAHFAANDKDRIMEARTQETVDQLKTCQSLNGGEWIGSVSEKYFNMLETGQPVWSPQYTLHKTLMGLYDDYRFLGNTTALETLENAADWFDHWTGALLAKGRGEVIYSGECAGMLELWADLYALKKDEKYLRLASRYARPDIFRVLLNGDDGLSNDHTNAGIPWIHGAARLYEITGVESFRQVVEAFWKQAVDDRGMFATTGNNAGEYWIPPQQFGRFLGSRTQEHCTVYNMIRVADYLFKWTGKACYADYIERALYNGILAQQNARTGLVSYFLPLEPGAKKVWGSEIHDFWCCHGTLVQAQAMYEDLIFYSTSDGIVISQFIPAEIIMPVAGHSVHLKMTLDTCGGRADFTAESEITHWNVKLQLLENTGDSSWTLQIRQPAWALEPGKVKINGNCISAEPGENGFLKIPLNGSETAVEVSFSKRIYKETLPGDKSRAALLDGPVVLAAITAEEPVLTEKSLALVAQYEHQYIDGREWQNAHFLMQSAGGTHTLKPLYEIVDETYTVYFRADKASRE